MRNVLLALILLCFAAVSAHAETAYGSDGTDFYSLNLTSGATKDLGQLRFLPVGMIQVGNVFYALTAADYICAFTADDPGEAQILGSLGILEGLDPNQALSYLPGTLFGDGGEHTYALYVDWINWQSRLYRIDLQKVTATFIGVIGPYPGIGGAAWDGTNGWVADLFSWDLVRIDVTTGAGTAVGMGCPWNSLSIDQGTLYGTYNGFDFLTTIDKTNDMPSFPGNMIQPANNPPWFLCLTSN